MKISIININNYEAFLLDKIEGNLSAELSAELSVFLEANDLQDFSEEDLVYLDEIDFQDSISDICLMSDDLKRFEPSLNEEKMIFEAVEGNLEYESDKKLKAWITNDPILKQHYEAMLATRTASDTLTYPDKSKLKRREPVVRYLYMLAAACVLGLIFFFSPSLTGRVDTPIVVNEQGKDQKAVDNKFNRNNGADSKKINNLNNSAEKLTSTEENVEIDNSIPLNQIKSISPSGIKIKTYSNDKANDLVAENNVLNDRPSNAPLRVQEDNTSGRMALTNLPRIARLGSERVMSIEPKSAIMNNYQNRKTREEEPLLAGAVNSIRDKIDYVDRKSAAIYGFADFQKNIIQTEGLFEVSKDRTPEGKVEGYSFRIAGFELSTAK